MSEDARMESAALLERIVSQDPATPLYLPLAERMREQGRVEEAIRLCEGRRGRPGGGVGDRIVLGRCYLAAGRLAEARVEFESALSLDRENVAALKALAGILSHQGDHASAADLYRAVCRVDPGDLESQTALHQITSGEFPEVRPPDLVVAQGDPTWQPVRLPREEEHMAELSLGLHTIETFDAEAPLPYTAKVQDFREVTIERLEVERTGPPARGVPPPAAPAAAEVPAPEPPAARAATAAPPEAEPAEESTSHAAARWAEIRRAPQPSEPPARSKGVAGNKSSFETWLTRLKGGGRS